MTWPGGSVKSAPNAIAASLAAALLRAVLPAIASMTIAEPTTKRRDHGDLSPFGDTGSSWLRRMAIIPDLAAAVSGAVMSNPPGPFGTFRFGNR